MADEDAFHKGYKDGKSWKANPQNPYEVGSIDYQRYERGYDLGCEEFNKKREKDAGFRP